MSDKIKWLKCSDLSFEDAVKLYDELDKNDNLVLMVKSEGCIEKGFLSCKRYCCVKDDFTQIEFNIDGENQGRMTPTHYVVLEFEDA